MEQERIEKNPPKILIIDDISVNVKILEDIVMEMGYEPLCALSAQEAMDIMDKTMPQLILSDYAMPGMDGLEFCKLLKSNPVTREIPVVFITVADSEEERKQAYEAGVVDFIHKPFDKQEAMLRIRNQLTLYYTQQDMEDYNRMLYSMLAEQKKKTEREQEKLLLALAKVVEKKSSYQKEHLARVAYNCRVLAQSMQLVSEYENKIPDEFIDMIETSAKVHSIGSILVTDEIFQREYDSEQAKQDAIARIYVDEGTAILEEIRNGDDSSPFLNMAIQIVRYYHARWDGSGYPAGVSGEDIPLAARITAIVNDFDALTSEHAGNSVEEGIEMIRERSGSVYDPDITAIFQKVVKQMKTGSK